MTPECLSAWRNYECKVDVLAAGVYLAFEAGWQAATEAAVNAALARDAPLVGHVCEGSPHDSKDAGRKPSLCWICGQALPHDCVGGAHEQPCWQAAWEDRQPVEVSQGSVTVSPAAFGPNVLIGTVHDRVRFLVERADVGDLVACLLRAYDQGVQLTGAQPADKLDGFALLPDAQATHGPPRGVDNDTLCGCSLPPHTIAQCVVRGVKRLTIAGRKWPIGTPDETAYYYGTADEWYLRLHAARTHRGLTLDALGAKLDPPRTRKDISAMEHGRRGLSVELCAQLADALDCDRLWLAGWTL